MPRYLPKTLEVIACTCYRKVLKCTDASQVDWEHLDGSNFTELTLSKVGNGLSIFASQLPYLPTVTTLGLQECNNSSFSIPSPWLLPNLKHLLLKNNNLTDKDLDRLLGPWKGIRVAHIDLGHNQLTVFPEPLLSFPALVTIKLNNNNLKSLMAALNFSSFVVEMIDLSYNSIRTIERTNAFHGKSLSWLINIICHELLLFRPKCRHSP